MKILQIPLLRDNYGYLIVCQKTNQTAIVDPSEALKAAFTQRPRSSNH